MDKFRIQGPTRLAGKVAASGAKNAALPALAATLLGEGRITLKRLPAVRDIATMRRLLSYLGVPSEEREDPGGDLEVAVEAPPSLGADDAPYDLVKTMRASVLVLGPLLARRGHARVSMPGGCAIGVRPIDQHLAAFAAMGADLRLEQGYVDASARRLRGCTFTFSCQTVTGTENVMMAAALARGTTVLLNCAQEPEVVDLARLLNRMGARIEGAGTTTLRIEGVDGLGGAEHTVITDRIESGTFLIGAVMTRGDVLVEGADAGDLRALLEVLEACGAHIAIEESGVRVSHRGAIRPRDVLTAPHPGFPTDLQAQYVALACLAEGRTRVCETVFENRFQHVAELTRMGASITLEGTFAHIVGPSELSGARVMATDLRASACLVLAGMSAEGETIVDRIYHLDRGYARMESKLQLLGASVERTQ
jgi:UDP-N-acetylglucosamine 1-carboxyvinyltransferase